MPSVIAEMGLIVQEKDPRKNEGVQKIKMHFHWSWTCKSCTINHSRLKIPINGPECWGSHMVCLCNIWFGHLFGISMRICQCQIQTCACCLASRPWCQGGKEECVLKNSRCFRTTGIGKGFGKELEDWKSLVSWRKQKAEGRSSQEEEKVLGHVLEQNSEEAACLERNSALSHLSQMCRWHQVQGWACCSLVGKQWLFAGLCV